MICTDRPDTHTKRRGSWYHTGVPGDDPAELAEGGPTAFADSSTAYLDAQRSALQVLARTGAVSPSRAVALRAELDQVAAALRHCHRILHTMTDP